MEALERIPARPAMAVDLPRDRFEVGWIDAQPYTAQVIRFQSLRDRSNERLVCPTVSACHPISAAIVHVEQAIALPGASSPQPAGSQIRAKCRERSILVDVEPESLSVRAVPVALGRAATRAKAPTPRRDHKPKDLEGEVAPAPFACPGNLSGSHVAPPCDVVRDRWESKAPSGPVHSTPTRGPGSTD